MPVFDAGKAIRDTILAAQELGIPQERLSQQVKITGEPDPLINEIMDVGLSIDQIKRRLSAQFGVVEESPIQTDLSGAVSKLLDPQTTLKLFPQAVRQQEELYSEVAPKFARTQQNIINELFPQQSGLAETLAADVGGRLESGTLNVPSEIVDLLQRREREAASARGFLFSGESGRREAEAIAQFGLQQRQGDVNTALALSSMLPRVQPISPTNLPGTGLLSNIQGMMSTGIGGALGLLGFEQQQDMMRAQQEAATNALAAQQFAERQSPSLFETFSAGFLGEQLGSFGAGSAGGGQQLGGVAGALQTAAPFLPPPYNMGATVASQFLASRQQPSVAPASTNTLFNFTGSGSGLPPASTSTQFDFSAPLTYSRT